MVGGSRQGLGLRDLNFGVLGWFGGLGLRGLRFRGLGSRAWDLKFDK